MNFRETAEKTEAALSECLNKAERVELINDLLEKNSTSCLLLALKNLQSELDRMKYLISTGSDNVGHA